jgi:hypothetical protein
MAFITSHDATAANVIQSTAPATRSITFPKSDSDYIADALDKPLVTRGIITTIDGTLELRLVGDTGDTMTLVAKAGVIYPLAVVQVLDTGTDAGFIADTVFGLL